MNRYRQKISFGEDCCDFCGQPKWTAEWRLYIGILHICRECAFMWLPALFADATWFPAWQPLTGVRNLDAFDANFWKAQTNNCCLHKSQPDHTQPKDDLQDQKKGGSNER